MVQMPARGSSAVWRRSRAACAGGAEAASEASFSPILPRSSAAAARVKVMTRKRSTSAGFSASSMRPISRSTSTRVFPLPAAADTSSSPPRSDIAAAWPGVGLNSAIFLSSFHHLPHL